MLVSLIEEIKKQLYLNNKLISDIVWVGSRDGTVRGTWQDFYTLYNYYYSCLFNFPQVPLDLVIMGNDWHLCFEYNNKWHWQYYALPLQTQEHTTILYKKYNKTTARIYLTNNLTS